MIYIDTPRKVFFRNRARQSSHMASDLNTKELIAFAKSIGLKEAWIKNRGEYKEHIDLFDGAIEKAIAAGAIVISPRDLVIKVMHPKRLYTKSIQELIKESVPITKEFVDELQSLTKDVTIDLDLPLSNDSE